MSAEVKKSRDAMPRGPMPNSNEGYHMEVALVSIFVHGASAGGFPFR
jgi:hypothetical protein